jgi:hypothetical protein
VPPGAPPAHPPPPPPRLGCDTCQGYYFARPQPGHAFQALLGQLAGGSLPVLAPAGTGDMTGR